MYLLSQPSNDDPGSRLLYPKGPIHILRNQSTDVKKNPDPHADSENANYALVASFGIIA